jgi:hypothetical protein
MSLRPYMPTHTDWRCAPSLNEASWKCRDCAERIPSAALRAIMQTHGAVVLWHLNEEADICGPVELLPPAVPEGAPRDPQETPKDERTRR